MKYFIFIDRNAFPYSQTKIWKTVLNLRLWPELWKHVISVSIHSEGELSPSSTIDCRFTLFHSVRLDFKVRLIHLKPPHYASFRFSGDFSGQGRWILRKKGTKTSSILYLRLCPHHKLLRLISFFPFGNEFIQYTHKRVMLEGKKMIIQKLYDD